MLGSWAGQGRREDVLTLRASLTQKIGSTNVRYARGSEIIGGSDEQMSGAVKAAEQSDVAILALGENAPEMTGEAGSRAFLGLPGKQEQLLEKVAATGKPVVLLIFSGRPLTLPWAFEHVPTVVAAWFPGLQAGPALVRMLFGEANPSGKLVVSWPRSVGQEPLYHDALNTGRPTRDVDLTRPPRNADEKYVSRYIDEQNSPQFPFGFGLSYTTFRYENPAIDKTTLSAKNLNDELHARERSANTVLNVSAEITNTGTRAGDETVQIYLRLQGTSVALPVRALVGFQRISLAPGETKKVKFPLGAEAFAFWNDQNNFAAEPARATLWVGPDSSRGVEAALEITK
jgi:beta-glucosidase